jgi:hypothetical protein
MPHAAAVSRYLGRSFVKATGEPSGRIRGWWHFTAGYVVQSRPDGTVRVEYQSGDGARMQTEETKEHTSTEKLREYAKHLEERYSVKLVSPAGTGWRQDHLIVSDKLPEPFPGPVTELPDSLAGEISTAVQELRSGGGIQGGIDYPAKGLEQTVLDALNDLRREWADRFEAAVGEHGRANGPGLLLAAEMIRPEKTEEQ